jgi:hypothetical protein
MFSLSYLKSKLHKKTIAEEVAEVCDRIISIKKNGLNDEDPEDPFAYLRIVDLCDALKGELFQRGILFLPNDVEQRFEQMRDDEGKLIERCVVRTEFSARRRKEVVNLGASYGSAKNRSDKALAIAQTSAFKAWLKRVSMVYGEADDPDASKRESDPTAKESVRIASYQKRAWGAATAQVSMTREQINEALTKIMGFPIDADQIPDLPRKDFDVAMKWLLAQGQDLTGQWSAAVADIKKRRGPQAVVTSIDSAHKDEPQFGD